MTVYEQMIEANIPTDHRESDLYVKATPEARAILTASGRSFSPFINHVEGEIWYDVPFAYDPFWDNRSAAWRRNGAAS